MTERGPLGPAAGELRRRAPVDPAADLRPDALLDGALRALGDSLRAVVPLDSLAGPLLQGAGLHELLAGNLLGGRPVTSSPSPPARPVDAGRGRATRRTRSERAARRAELAAAHLAWSASAQPPAAEAGGRPGSPLPRKGPAPAAPGAAAPAPSGVLFAPFLALLVLAALVAPRLMRRLDATPAFLRPAPFVCALERPG